MNVSVDLVHLALATGRVASLHSPRFSRDSSHINRQRRKRKREFPRQV